MYQLYKIMHIYEILEIILLFFVYSYIYDIKNIDLNEKEDILGVIRGMQMKESFQIFMIFLDFNFNQ